MISACLWVLGSRAWTFFMSRAYGGEGRGCSTVQQDSSDAGTGGAGGKLTLFQPGGWGAYSAHSLLPASLNRIHLVNLEKEKCKIDQRLLL